MAANAVTITLLCSAGLCVRMDGRLNGSANASDGKLVRVLVTQNLYIALVATQVQLALARAATTRVSLTAQV